jgi:hypothetical protein
MFVHQDLYFCGSQTTVQTCSSGWGLQTGAIAQLQRRQQLLDQECLQYKPKVDSDDPIDNCGPPLKTCRRTNEYASQGKFGAIPVSNMWEAQRYIRQYGAVVTSFQIMSDFESFFNKTGNAKKTYSPSAGAKALENHAVVLVGYDNYAPGGGYWLVLNSWGTKWADRGLFKVTCMCRTRPSSCWLQ